MAAAVLVGATMGFTLRGTSAPYFNADIPERVAPAVKGRMVAELAALVNFMLETFNDDVLAENYTPLTTEEVARWRDAWVPDVPAVREELMSLLAEAAGRAPEAAR